MPERKDQRDEYDGLSVVSEKHLEAPLSKGLAVHETFC